MDMTRNVFLSIDTIAISTPYKQLGSRKFYATVQISEIEDSPRTPYQPTLPNPEARQLADHCGRQVLHAGCLADAVRAVPRRALEPNLVNFKVEQEDFGLPYGGFRGKS